jgi:hypothetical protein
MGTAFALTAAYALTGFAYILRDRGKRLANRPAYVRRGILAGYIPVLFGWFPMTLWSARRGLWKEVVPVWFHFALVAVGLAFFLLLVAPGSMSAGT